MESSIKTKTMGAKEFRLGNFINEYGSPVTINIAKLVYMDSNKDLINTIYSGIPLTEERLLKLGFRLGDDGYTRSAFYGENPVTKDYLLVLKNVGDGWFYRNGHFKIEYIHQLQNLIFALCGEELRITQKSIVSFGVTDKNVMPNMNQLLSKIEMDLKFSHNLNLEDVEFIEERFEDQDGFTFKVNVYKK